MTKPQFTDVVHSRESRYDRMRVLLNLIKYRDPFFPRRINLTISDWCNRRCSYCPNSVYGSPETKMTDEVFFRAIHCMQEIDWTGMVTFNGYGEPLANDDLEYYVRYVKLSVPKCMPWIYTNGDYLTVDRAHSLFQAGVHSFIVTRHEPYSHAWDDKMRNLLKKVVGNRITVRSLKPSVITNTAGLTDVVQEPFNHCLLPSTGLVINVNGDIALCCADYLRESKQGNIMKSSIPEIWNSPRFKKIRWNLLIGRKDKLPELCVRCMAGKGAKE